MRKTCFISLLGALFLLSLTACDADNNEAAQKYIRHDKNAVIELAE